VSQSEFSVEQSGDCLTDTLIKRRCVISIGDYDSPQVTQQYANFQAGLKRFSQTWNVATRISPLRTEADGAIAIWRTEAKAPNWVVQTDFRILNWPDVFGSDTRWSLDRAWRTVKAGADFISSGTWWHYFRLNWRFGLFFFYPLLAVLLLSFLCLWLSAFLGNMEVPFASLLAISALAALSLSYLKWIDPVGILRVLNMWTFVHELIHLQKANLADRLGIFVEDLKAILAVDDFDEIVLVGHGFGAVFQPLIVDRAFWAMPEFGKDGRSISLLSLGSMLLAVGSHPEGAWVVMPASRIARDRWVYWAEYQAQEDVLNFPGKSPLAELLSDHRKPVLQRISIRKMIELGGKGRLASRINQIHRQYVRANTKKYFYDYFMVACGPFHLRTRVKFPSLMTEAFDSDGRLVSEPQPTRTT
jgi:hypothetical protein